MPPYAAPRRLQAPLAAVYEPLEPCHYLSGVRPDRRGRRPTRGNRMPETKHYVYSARTTEDGLAALNKIRQDRVISWDRLINDAVCEKYAWTRPPSTCLRLNSSRRRRKVGRQRKPRRPRKPPRKRQRGKRRMASNRIGSPNRIRTYNLAVNSH